MSDDLAILQSYIDRCSNWGRWGADDQLGNINLITPEKVREAAGLVKTGKTVHNWTARIVTRGVFVDLAADRGVESLELGYAITTDDLEEYLDAKGSRPAYSTDSRALRPVLPPPTSANSVTFATALSAARVP
ncbi:putative cyclase [Mycolicibacter sinensis]|uniref:Cyclase n=1 Tax=Mycolicibacter sinensis (strain JDM601) TaxID=875328 RepID=F5YSS0_MYCSD|nr:putative cyclase [Mycolicibacter sinensis]